MVRRREGRLTLRWYGSDGLGCQNCKMLPSGRRVWSTRILSCSDVSSSHRPPPQGKTKPDGHARLTMIWMTMELSLMTFLSSCKPKKLKNLEKQTGYSKVYFFTLTCAILSMILYVLGGFKLITDLVTFIYPAYMSFKAIDSANEADHTQWLTYWVVYSFFSITESVAGFLTEFIPFYFLLKIAFFVWLYHPKFMGAGLVYTQAIKPFVMPHLNSLTKSVTSSTTSTTKKTE